MTTDQIRLILESTSDIIHAFNNDFELLYCNHAFHHITGFSDHPSTCEQFIDNVYYQDRTLYRHILEQVSKGQSFDGIDIRLLHVSGDIIWCASSWWPLFDEHEYQIGICCRYHPLNLSKPVVQRHPRELEYQQILADISTLLAASTNFHDTLQQLTSLIVSSLADFCAIDVLDKFGEVQRLSLAFQDSLSIFREYSLNRIEGVHRQFMAQTLEKGEPIFVSHIHPENLRSFAIDEQHYQALVASNFRSTIMMPLYAREHSFGLLICLISQDQPAYTYYELRLFEEIGRRISLFIDNERLYQEAQSQFKWLQGVVESIGDAVIITDSQGIITFANQQAEILTGYPRAEIIGLAIHSVFRIYSDDSQTTQTSLFTDVIKYGQTVKLDNQHLLLPRVGEPIPIDQSAAPIRDSQGSINGMVLVFRDISERKLVEDQLVLLNAQISRQRQHLRDILATVPVVVWEVWGNPLHVKYPIEFVSDYAETMLGYSIEEWRSNLNFWLSIVHPDDRERAARERHELFYTATKGTSEYRWITKDGRILWIESQAVVITNEQNEPMGMRGISMDITARKRAAEAQQFLINISSLLATSLDLDVTLERLVNLIVPAMGDWCMVHLLEPGNTIRRLKFVHVNSEMEAAVREMPETASIDEHSPNFLSAVIRTGKSKRYNDIDVQMLAGLTQNARLFRLFQTIGLYSYMCVPLKAQGQLIGAISFAWITPRKQYSDEDLTVAEDIAVRAAFAIENARLYREAQEAIQAREVFLSVASHELKTPLTSLMGNVQLLQRRAQREQHMNERDLRSLQLVNAQAQRLNRMITALLDLSRIQTGQLSIEHLIFDVGQLVQRTVQEAIPSSEQHEYVQQLWPEPLLINGDELRLEQVLQNLLQNAVKYSPNGGQITVCTYCDQANAYIEISDQGIGIPAASQPRLFTRFFRASNVNPLYISGIGVGLYVVKEIITLHDGEINVASEEGVGSTFTIRLPLVQG